MPCEPNDPSWRECPNAKACSENGWPTMRCIKTGEHPDFCAKPHFDARKTPRANKEEVVTDTYKGWLISPPDMCPFWTATGPNYDASYEGPEDGWVDNGEKVEARTYKDLLVEIEDFIACSEEHVS